MFFYELIKFSEAFFAMDRVGWLKGEAAHLTFIILTLILNRILLCLFIGRIAKQKDIKNNLSWIFATIIFGYLAVIVFVIFTSKNKDSNTKKQKRTNILLIALSLLIVVINIFGYIYGYANTYKSTTVRTTFNINGHAVVYDKSGNKYSAWRESKLKFYDKDGNEYVNKTIGSFQAGYYCKKTNTVYGCINTGNVGNIDDTESLYKFGYSISDKDLLIDSNGYAVAIDTFGLYYSSEYDLYYDRINNLIFYEPYSSSWDKDGNLLNQVNVNDIIKDMNENS